MGEALKHLAKCLLCPFYGLINAVRALLQAPPYPHGTIL